MAARLRGVAAPRVLEILGRGHLERDVEPPSGAAPGGHSRGAIEAAREVTVAGNALLVALGASVRCVRVERGLSYRELARHAGVSIGTISHIENGRHCPTAATLTRLLSVLCTDDAVAAALWSIWRAARDGERVAPGHNADGGSVLARINELSRLRQLAWARGDAATANALTCEIEALWDAYRRARARAAGNTGREAR